MNRPTGAELPDTQKEEADPCYQAKSQPPIVTKRCKMFF